jgi:hypothetical protein
MIQHEKQRRVSPFPQERGQGLKSIVLAVALVAMVALASLACGPPPLPTDKAQCKNGGWQQVGVFKNQGDCVSYVETGGKNEPGRQK